ncbi:DUF2288 domain-containing protein [bacterium]|nr:DUF2288 domain-containing protein [bacterium]
MTKQEDIKPELSKAELIEKLNNEIAPVPWKDLQIVFARGITIFVSPELELVEVAFQISNNNTSLVEQWMAEEKLDRVIDEQAKEWFETEAELLTAIVKPWVLVQTISR